jgi:hypothetical protein
LGTNLQSTIAQIDSYSSSFGGFKNAALLHSEQLSERVSRFVYIAHTKILPIAFEIFVYKTDAGWKVTSFQFDSDMDVIFPALK